MKCNTNDAGMHTNKKYLLLYIPIDAYYLSAVE